MALNPGLLAQIGRGLSLGGGVLNADIFAQQQQERAQAKLNAEQRRAALAQFIVQAAQGGIMSPEDAQTALRAAAPEMAESLKGALGPSLEVQRSALKFQQDQQARADRAAWLEGQGLPQGIPDSVVASLFKAQTTQDKAASALGKLADDFRNGRITREEYEAGKRKALYIAPTSSEGDQRERKIQSLMAQGLDRARATNVVDRNIDIKINDATGRIVMTDLVTNQVTELPVVGAGQRAEIPSGQTLFDMSGGVTGVVPGAAEAISGVTGQVGLPVARDTIERRQAFRTAQNDMVRALAVNARFPVAEMERIRDEINLAPGVFDSTESLQARMRSIDRSLRNRLSQIERDANDPSLPEALRSSQAQNAAAIRNFLDQLGAPSAGKGISETDDALIRKWLNQ